MRHCLASPGCLFIVGATLCSVPAFAQQQEGRAFKIGEADVVPAVEIEYISNSNAFLEQADETKTTAVVVSPELTWLADQRLLQIKAGYSGEYASYSEDALNYDDHLLEFSVDSDFSARSRLGVDLSFANEHEDLGTERTRGLGASFGSPVESNIFTVNADYTYGGRVARGNATVGLLVQTISFTDPDDGDVAGENVTDGDDFSLIQPYARFSLRLSPDTRVLTEFRFNQFDFDANTRDRSEITLLAGVEFSGSQKTGGSAKIGGTLATYTEDVIEDQTELVADINVFFLPRTYSRFSLSFSRELDNLTDPDSADQAGNNLVQATRDRAQFSWRQDWSTRFNTIARATATNIDRDCLNDVLTTGYGFEANVLPRRWVEFGLSAGVSERAGSSNNVRVTL